MNRIILASGSPRRKEIMEIMQISYEVIVSDVEEIVSESDPEKLVIGLSSQKANAVVEGLSSVEVYSGHRVIVIGADTMVFYKGQALGKPKDEEDAKSILSMLSGNAHDVYTGVSVVILEKEERKEINLAVKTSVVVEDLSEEEIAAYIQTGEPMDKAGAYGIQGAFGIHIKEIIGDYYNVVGFPIGKIYTALLEQGINMKEK